MEHDDRAYCFDFNEQGYCKVCGKPRKASLDELGAWPTDTWFQRRRLEVALRELSKVQS